jgi:predicted dehydrogenase
LIRTAVVGVGSLGEHHARIYHQMEGVRLAAICDLREDRGNSIATQLGVPFIPRVEDLLGKVDAVSLVTPTVEHARLGEFFLRQGVHVLVEKPISSTIEEGRRLIDVAEGEKRILQVGHLERFNPAVTALQERIHHPRFFEGHRLSVFQPRSLDIDVVLDLMIHDLDLVLSMVKSEIDNIQAIGIPVLSPKIDIANARIQFRNGCVANLTASRVSDEKVRKLRFFQPSDYISIDFLKRESEIVRLIPSEKGPFPVLDRCKIQTSPEEQPLQMELAAFVDTVRGLRPNPCTGEEGLRALEAALHVIRVMKTA